jgi:hypothetical protein
VNAAPRYVVQRTMRKNIRQGIDFEGVGRSQPGGVAALAM